MKTPTNVSVGPSVPQFTPHVITEKLALQRFNDFLKAELALGSRSPKDPSLYQVVIRGEEWVGPVLWTVALCHFESESSIHDSRDAVITPDRSTRRKLQPPLPHARLVQADPASPFKGFVQLVVCPWGSVVYPRFERCSDNARQVDPSETSTSLASCDLVQSDPASPFKGFVQLVVCPWEVLSRDPRLFSIAIWR